MLGAIAGDVIGSVYENLRTKRKDFRLFHRLATFTDDTVLTIAVAEALLSDRDFRRSIRGHAWRRPFRGSVPEAIIAFLDSTVYEDAVRNAVSLGGDADTQASIAGAIAEAHYGGVPAHIAERVWAALPPPHRQLIRHFHRAFRTPTDIEELAGADSDRPG